MQSILNESNRSTEVPVVSFNQSINQFIFKNEKVSFNPLRSLFDLGVAPGLVTVSLHDTVLFFNTPFAWYR